MTPEIFADGIGNITVSNGVVRIEYVRLKQSTATNDTREYETTHHVYIPLQSFKTVAERQSALLSKLQSTEMGAPAET
jgi:hypothetical protein